MKLCSCINSIVKKGFVPNGSRLGLIGIAHLAWAKSNLSRQNEEHPLAAERGKYVGDACVSEEH